MLLSEVLAADLGLRLLSAPPGAVDRPLGRLVITDLLEPGRYVGSGEAVLTGLVWRRRPADSATFVASVAQRGVEVIFAGRALLGEIPQDLTTACQQHDVSLVEVPVELSFADITDYVAAQDAPDQADLRASVSAARRQRQLLSALASGSTLDEVLTRVSTEIGSDCRCLSATGRHVVPGPGTLTDQTVDALTEAYLTAERLPATESTPDGVFSIFPVGPGLGSRVTSWLVVAAGDHQSWSREQRDAVHDLCAIAALDHSRRDDGLRTRRSLTWEAVRLTETGAPLAEVVPRLRQAGVETTRPCVVVAASGRGAAEDATAVLEDLALRLGPAVVATMDDGRAVALLPAEADLTATVRTALQRLAPGLGAGDLAVGLSNPAESDSLAGALEEARFALRAAQGASAPVTVVGSDEVTSHVLLLAAVPDDVRRSFAQRVLRGVLDHDERTNGELVTTLTAFLDCSASWARTAEALHLHVNTVRYRIERIQELTGRDLSSLEDRVDVFLALKSL